jgi:hypothetical protein
MSAEFSLFIIFLAFVVYFCIATYAAHRSWKAFWMNLSISFLALCGLAASHTDHNLPTDGLPELALLILFVALFFSTGLAWLCSFMAIKISSNELDA